MTPPRMAALIRAAAETFDVSAEQIRRRDKTKAASYARFAVYLAARRRMGRSYPEIARMLRRDHSSIMSGVRKAEHLRAIDPDYRAMSDAVLAALPEAQ